MTEKSDISKSMFEDFLAKAIDNGELETPDGWNDPEKRAEIFSKIIYIDPIGFVCPENIELPVFKPSETDEKFEQWIEDYIKELCESLGIPRNLLMGEKD